MPRGVWGDTRIVRHEGLDMKAGPVRGCQQPINTHLTAGSDICPLSFLLPDNWRLVPNKSLCTW